MSRLARLVEWYAVGLVAGAVLFAGASTAFALDAGCTVDPSSIVHSALDIITISCDTSSNPPVYIIFAPDGSTALGEWAATGAPYDISWGPDTVQAILPSAFPFQDGTVQQYGNYTLVAYDNGDLPTETACSDPAGTLAGCLAAGGVSLGTLLTLSPPAPSGFSFLSPETAAGAPAALGAFSTTDLQSIFLLALLALSIQLAFYTLYQIIALLP